MPQILVTDRTGADVAIEGEDGLTVMELIRGAGFEDNFALCGGNCSCATCHVYFEDTVFERLPAMSAEENELLDGSSHRRRTSRLSCQVQYDDQLAGTRIIVAPED